MIDTMGIYVVISHELRSILESKAIKIMKFHNESGQILFEFSNFENVQSWNYHIHFAICDKVWAYNSDKKVTNFVSSLYPFLRFEFSVPKLLWGNNLRSASPTLIYEALAILKDKFEKQFNCQLPGFEDWFPYRVDVCANWILPGYHAVTNYISDLQKMTYPRRIKNLYEDTGIYFSSRVNTLKVYAKGAEFKKHDSKRFSGEELRTLQDEAYNILRVEVELKDRLNYLYDKYREGRVKTDRLGYSDGDDEFCFDETGKRDKQFNGYFNLGMCIRLIDFEGELKRCIEKHLCGMGNVTMKIEEAYQRMVQGLSVERAKYFWGIYMLCVTNGPESVKKNISRKTWYRARKIFNELGLSFVLDDLLLVKNGDVKLYPADFQLTLEYENKYYQKPLKKVA